MPLDITYDLPKSYLDPLQTALGQAWPRPRVRRIMEDLENVQKRLGENQMKRNGIMKTPKDVRQERWDMWTKECTMLERELDRILEQFKKTPATKEQFKRPTAQLSECCDAYTTLSVAVTEEGIPEDEQPTSKYKCAECGRSCITYVRMEREDWEKEYKEVQLERKKEAEAQLQDKKNIENPKSPPPVDPMRGGYLIT